MRKFIFCIISLLVGLLLFVVAMQQAGIDDILKTVSLFPPSIIILAFALNSIAICIIGSWRWKIIIESQNSHKISFLKVLKAKLAGFAVSYITPSVLVGGEPVKAYMIKEDIDCTWEKSFASVIIDTAVYFFSLFLFMIVGFLFLINYFPLPFKFFCGIGILIVFDVFILHLFYSRVLNKSSDGDGFFTFILKISRLNKIKFIKSKEKNIKKTERIITQFFKNKKKAFLKAFFLSILEIVCYVAFIFVIVFYLNRTGVVFELVQSVSIFFLITLANLVPIPGSLGSFETALTFAFDLLDLGKSNGFTFSLIYRFVNIILVVIGFFALIYFEITTTSRRFGSKAPEVLLKMHRFFKKMIRKK